MSERYIGIDVSKEHLDVASSGGWTVRVGNDAAGHAQLCERLKGESAKLIVMEATGGLERCLAVALAAEELPIRVVNARLVRHFAKASGLLAKTDRIDAQVLVRFGQAMKLEAREPVGEQLRALQALVTRRRQLVEMQVMERNRLSTAHNAVKPQVLRTIKWLEKQLASNNTDTDDALRVCGVWQEKVELLESVPGIGRVISLSLIATLPSLAR